MKFTKILTVAITALFCLTVAGAVVASDDSSAADVTAHNIYIEVVEDSAGTVSSSFWMLVECENTVDAFIEALAGSGGVYFPFVPEDQSPNVGNHLTPDTDTFLFGITVSEHLEFSPFADTQVSSEGWYTLAQVPEGKRLLDSALHGLDNHTLHESETAQLFIFDEDRYHNGRLSLSLLACAKDSSAALFIENSGRSQRISLSSEPFVYNISLLPGDVIITSEDGDVLILTYQTK